MQAYLHIYFITGGGVTIHAATGSRVHLTNVWDNLIHTLPRSIWVTKPHLKVKLKQPTPPKAKQIEQTHKRKYPSHRRIFTNWKQQRNRDRWYHTKEIAFKQILCWTQQTHLGNELRVAELCSASSHGSLAVFYNQLFIL